jgi:hypothetical protein
MGMDSREWYRDEPSRIGKRPSWDNFSVSPRTETIAPQNQKVVKIIRPLKKSQPPSHLQRQAQQILEAHSASQQGSLWPVYGIFLFAFGMLGYVSYNLMY